MRLVLLALCLIATVARGETPDAFLDTFAREARRENAAFAAFSAERGRTFFTAMHGREWSCSSCHTANPSAAGRHAATGKPITPLAPSAAADRFTSPAKVEKWFKRNCNDVAGRACTAQEKGDILTWLLARR